MKHEITVYSCMICGNRYEKDIYGISGFRTRLILSVPEGNAKHLCLTCIRDIRSISDDQLKSINERIKLPVMVSPLGTGGLKPGIEIPEKKTDVSDSGIGTFNTGEKTDETEKTDRGKLSSDTPG